MSAMRVARRYAAALMEVADTTERLARIGDDLDGIARVIDSSRELFLLLRSPVVGPARKWAVLEAVFGGRIGADTATFLKLLVAKKREDILPEIVAQFRMLRDRREGTVEAEAVSAVELSDAQGRTLERELEAYTGKRVRLRQSVDPAIRAGLVVRLGDTVLDGSLRRQLELLRERLVEPAAA